MHRATGAALLALMVAVSGGRAVKQTASGIEQFWTDDYKVFDQVYGKTSDKELFGATLPPSISFGLDTAKLNKEASEKKERYLDSYRNSDLDLDQTDPYSFGARYPAVLNQGVKLASNKVPIKTTSKFIPSDFKPFISQESDPETYNYLKHLELLQKQKEKFSQINLNGFQPLLNYGAGKPEDTEGYKEGYKSIQDILEAHEANKGKGKDDNETNDQVKYLTYGGGKGRGPGKKTKARPSSGKGYVPKGSPGKGKPPCSNGRCRKRNTTTFRGRTYLTRPIVRKIKHKIVSY